MVTSSYQRLLYARKETANLRVRSALNAWDVTGIWASGKTWGAAMICCNVFWYGYVVQRTLAVYYCTNTMRSWKIEWEQGRGAAKLSLIRSHRFDRVRHRFGSTQPKVLTIALNSFSCRHHDRPHSLNTFVSHPEIHGLCNAINIFLTFHTGSPNTHVYLRESRYSDTSRRGCTPGVNPCYKMVRRILSSEGTVRTLVFGGFWRL